MADKEPGQRTFEAFYQYRAEHTGETVPDWAALVSPQQKSWAAAEAAVQPGNGLAACSEKELRDLASGLNRLASDKPANRGWQLALLWSALVQKGRQAG
jgi:hypothetical protein